MARYHVALPSSRRVDSLVSGAHVHESERERGPGSGDVRVDRVALPDVVTRRLVLLLLRTCRQSQRSKSKSKSFIRILPHRGYYEFSRYDNMMMRHIKI